MIDNIELFILVLSMVFILRFIGEFGVKLLQTTPNPLEINKYETITTIFLLIERNKEQR